MAQGATSLHLLRMLRERISAQVHDAVKRAIALDRPVQLPRLAMSANDGAKTVSLEVLPMHTPGTHPRWFLVLFPSVRNPFESDDLIADGSAAPIDKDRTGGPADDDLTVTKLYLRSLIEERDTRNQELVSANEEIQSSQ
jgi:two-component system CheB/CheR fusion protein